MRTTKLLRRSYAWTVLCAAGLLLSVGSSRAQEQPSQEGVPHETVPQEIPQVDASADAPIVESRPDHFVVLRLSGRMLNSLLDDKPVNFSTGVNDVVLGTPVSGVAQVVGQPRVELEPSVDEARFIMRIQGTVFSRTVGNAGVVKVHGRSITRFTATQRVVFDPGKGFSALPPEIEASSQVFTDRIVPSRGGLIGRITERRAWEQVAEQRATVTAIARQRATARIAAAMERHMDERLARLNRTVEFRTLLANFRDQETGTSQLVCCTTPDYVEIGDTLASGHATIVLPVLESASEANAPIEIWVHQKLVSERIANALKTILASPDQNGLVQSLALLPGPLGKEAAAGLTALIADNQIGVQTVGDWTVVEVNPRRVEAVAARESLNR